MSPNVNGSAEDRINTHKNARLTPEGREHMVLAVVDCQLSKAAAARRSFLGRIFALRVISRLFLLRQYYDFQSGR
jgi:hypothetical protein